MQKGVFMSKDEENAKDLAAALDGREITDSDGDITETGDSEEDTATSEVEAEVEAETKPSEEESASGENPPEDEETETQSVDKSDEPEHAEDESGKRYVPESRFKSVYGQLKEAERKLVASQGIQNVRRDEVMVPNAGTTALEVEFLKDKYPQFDPSSDQYSEVVDQLGADILKSHPSMTRLGAAREALKRAKALTKATATVKSEAKAVKVAQADRGVSSRPAHKAEAPMDAKNMSEKDAEVYMKEHGLWD